MGIEQYLQQILSARYGKDVRQSIHDSIYEINEVAKKAEYDASTAQGSAKAYAQAALASEQAAEDYKTAAEQAAEQAMSGTPEGYADLVAKVNSIYRQTATSYSIVGTSEGSALAHTIYGMSEQDGTPTPTSPVEIKSAKANFKCVGKNLIPYPYSGITSKGTLEVHGVNYTDRGDGSILANGTNDSTINSWLVLANKIPIPKGYNVLRQKFVATGDVSTGMMIEVYDANNTSLGNKFCNAGLDYADFTIPSGAEKLTVQLYVVKGYSVSNVVCYPMLAFSNAPNMNFEPYHATQVSTDLTLRAIEVTSTDDYNLVKDGKYYVADTVDWSEDRGYEITRRIGHGILSDFITGWSASSANTFMCAMGKSFVDSLRSAIALNKYHNVYTKQPSDMVDGDAKFWVSNTNQWGFKNSNYSNIQEARAGETDTIVDYILATPTTEPITSEQAQALLSLKTYDEATSNSATGDIEPSVDLEYSKDRNTALALTGHNLAHKNALKLNDINTALIELGGN